MVSVCCNLRNLFCKYEKDLITMRIAYISNSFSKGGAASGNNSLIMLLEDLGHSVDRYEFKGINWAKKPVRTLSLWPIIICYFIFGKFIREKLSSPNGFYDYEDFQAYDVIFLGHLSNSIVNISSFIGKQNVFWRHSDLWVGLSVGHYKDPSLWYCKYPAVKRMLFNSTKNIFPSNWIMQELNPSKEVPSLLIRNFPHSADQELNFENNNNEPILGFCAASLEDKRKGFEHFYDLAKRSNSKFKYVAAGRSTKRFPEFITHLRHLNKVQLQKFYQRIEIIFVLSSVDNSPNVLVEALSLGVFPIVVPGSGASELLIEAFGECGHEQNYLYFDTLNSSEGKIEHFISKNIARIRTERVSRALQFERFRSSTIKKQSNMLKISLEDL